MRNTFGLEGVAAAYSPEGEEWLEELLVYLKGNAELVRDYVQEHLPQVDFVEPEGTFLCWLDLTRTGLTDAEILKRVESPEAPIFEKVLTSAYKPCSLSVGPVRGEA